MRRPRVLVTRPQPGADRTAARLAENGYEPVVLPLTQTVALPVNLPMFKPDLIIASSAQAFYHLDPAVAAELTGVRVVAVGEATAKAATDSGFMAVESGGSDMQSLLKRLDDEQLGAAAVIYLAGKARRPELERYLSKHAAKVVVLEIYDTVSVSYSTDYLADLARRGAFDAALVTSFAIGTETVRICRSSKIAQIFENTILIAISERVADAVRTAFPGRVHVAKAPDENGLLACLAAHCPAILG